VEILTDQDLLILEQLSDERGHPLWDLSETMARDKFGYQTSARTHARNIKGNLLKKLTRLEELEYIYKIERKSTRWNTRSKKIAEYPYYINKNSRVLYKIQHDLADPIEGKIWRYDKTHYIEQKEYDKQKWDSMKNHEEAPDISNSHLKARQGLTSFIHLYFWCDKIKKEIDDVVKTHRARYDSFSLVTRIPPCRICQEIQDRMKIDQYYRELQLILYQRKRFLAKINAQVCHDISDLRELQLAKL